MIHGLQKLEQLLPQTRILEQSPKNNEFRNTLDRSFSDRQALKNETDPPTEVTQHKKSILKIEKQLEQLQQENPTINLESMEEIVTLMSDTITELESESELDEGMLSILSTLTELLNQGMDQISEYGVMNDDTSFMIDKFTFIFEGTSSLNQIAESQPIILENIINDIQHLVASTEIRKNDLINNAPIEIVGFSEESIETHTGIELSSDFEVLEEPEILTDFSPTHEESITPKGMEFDFSSQDENTSEEQTVAIFDKRSKSLDTAELTSDQPQIFGETLESIDAEFSPNIENQINQQKFETTAQRSYTALSSAISRVQVEALMQSVAGKMSVILQDSGNELRMKLTPPELGQMKLSFITEDGIMRGKVVVETQEAKMFFEQNIDNLRQSLANEGIHLSQVDIDMGSQHDFSSNEELEENQSQKAMRISQNNVVQEIEQRNRLEDTLVDFTA